MIEWTSSEEEDESEIIVMDLPPGYTPKASRPKGEAVKVAAVDPNDVGEDGKIKLVLSSSSGDAELHAEGAAVVLSPDKSVAQGMSPKAKVARDPWSHCGAKEGMDQLLQHQHPSDG